MANVECAKTKGGTMQRGGMALKIKRGNRNRHRRSTNNNGAGNRRSILLGEERRECGNNNEWGMGNGDTTDAENRENDTDG